MMMNDITYKVEMFHLGKWKVEPSGEFVVGRDAPTDTDAHEAAVNLAESLGSNPVRVVKTTVEVVYAHKGEQPWPSLDTLERAGEDR